MCVQALAVAYIATQDTPCTSLAVRAAKRFRADVLEALASEADLVELVKRFEWTPCFFDEGW